jgi:hypothetical protein
MTILTHPREAAGRPASITGPAAPPADGVARPFPTATLSCLAAEIGRLLSVRRGRDEADVIAAEIRPQRPAARRYRSDLFAVPPVD